MPPGCFNGPERPSQPPRAEARQASLTVPLTEKTATSERWGWASARGGERLVDYLSDDSIAGGLVSRKTDRAANLLIDHGSHRSERQRSSNTWHAESHTVRSRPYLRMR